jgi:hypothetical protein
LKVVVRLSASRRVLDEADAAVATVLDHPGRQASVSINPGGDEGRKAQLFSPASRTVKQTAGQAGVDTERRGVA